MSCILRFSGESFDVDAFVSNSGLPAYAVFHKGEPEYDTKPDSRKMESSGCAILVSRADLNKFNQQVDDAILFLSEHRQALNHIPAAKGLEHAYLDFGVDFAPANGMVQSQHIPLELIKLTAELGISINLAMYRAYQED